MISALALLTNVSVLGAARFDERGNLSNHITTSACVSLEKQVYAFSNGIFVFHPSCVLLNMCKWKNQPLIVTLFLYVVFNSLFLDMVIRISSLC